VARLGMRLGDPIGAVEDVSCPLMDSVELSHQPAFGPRCYRLQWDYDAGFKFGDQGFLGDLLGGHRNFFKVYVNNQLAATQRGEQYIFTAPDGAPPSAAVVVVGPKNGDAGYDPACTAIPGNRVKLTWSRPATDTGLAGFNIYWDSGGGTVSYTTPLATVRDDGGSSFEWTSAKLADGTYKFVVRAFDVAGNEDTNTTTAEQAIASWPDPPTGLAYEYDAETDKVTLTWAGGAQCNIYSNGGAGEIDYDTPVEMGVYSGWESDALTGPGTFRYAVRAYNWVYEEQNTEYVEFELDADEAEVNRPLSPFGLTVAPVADAEFDVSGYFDARRPTVHGRTPPAIEEIRIYHDNATGTMDWNTEVDQVSVSPSVGGVQRFRFTTSAGAYAHGATVQFGARAATDASPDGETDENTTTASAVADDTPPSAPQSLAASAVRDIEGTG